MYEHSTPPTRRDLLAGMAGTSITAMVGLAARPVEAGTPNFGRGPLSGMPWHSGCGLGGITDFERFRGRKADLYTIWGAYKTWGDVPNLSGGFSAVKNMPGRISLAIAMLPASQSGLKDGNNWTLAARGAFDQYYVQHARNLANSGRKNLVLRIGWETNHTFPWFGGTNPQGFKDTFKRIADIQRKYNPTILTEWCNVKDGKQPGSVLTMYPGDDAVDIIGVDYYDNWPALNTVEIWNREHYATFRGGPKGIGAWMNFAKSRGKKLSCPEWGLSVGTSPGTKDNPVYIQQMHDFFARNSANFAYENYFNQKPQHQIMPSNLHPQAAAAYLRQWGA
jgi:Glycosyl hydrolase family 26